MTKVNLHLLYKKSNFQIQLLKIYLFINLLIYSADTRKKLARFDLFSKYINGDIFFIVNQVSWLLK